MKKNHYFCSLKILVMEHTVKLLLLFTLIVLSINVIAQSPCSNMLMNQDTSILPGTSVQLNAQGMFQYQWSPDSCFAHPEHASQSVTPANTTTYYVTGYYQDSNIVVNGNFSSGNSGFTSQYTYVATPSGSALWPEGTYAVGTNAANYHANFGSYFDHTTGTGNYMIVNGATVSNRIVWTQSIPVLPNTNYVFTTWTQTFSSPVADLQFSINGQQIGNIFQSPTTLGVWQQFYQIWNSGSSTSAVITILNQNTTAGGNDFGLDDISFCPLYPCTDSVTITVLTPIVAVNDTFVVCQGDTLTTYPLANDTIDYRCGTVIPYINYPTFYTPIHQDSTQITLMFDHLYNGMDSLQYVICCSGHCDTATMYFIVTGSHHIYSDTICSGESYHKYDFDIDSTQTMVSGLTYFADSAHTVFGCDSIRELYLQIFNQPNVQVDYFGCDSLRWNDQLITQSGDYIQYFTAYGGCDSVVTAHVTIKHDTVDIINMMTDFCKTMKTQLYAQSDLLNLRWNTGDNIPIIDVTEPGTYWVEASESGCVASDTLVIEECCPDSSFQLSNVITPSQQDGYNDFFKLPDEFIPTTLEIFIYDRWGRRVFKSEDPNFIWNGSVNGHVIPGVYYYSLRMNHRCNFHGSITVF